MNELINVKNENGVLLVSSREVAERFEKQHKDVIRDVEKISQHTSAENCANLFIASNYLDSYKRGQKEYLLTRDGFSLLAMGFTGSKALEWKLKFIDAFNKMEATLKEQLFPTGKNLIAMALIEANRMIEEKEEKIKVQDQLIGELKPKADYLDAILNNKSLMKITSIAKDYGMSGQAMNELLHELKIQYKSGNQWLLYSKYQASGYTHSETVTFTRSNGKTDVNLITKWSQKGRLFLYEKLKENGVIPVIEQD